MGLNIQEYLEITSIHGLFYISKQFKFIERFFWIIALIFSFSCTAILVFEVVVKIQNFPIVVYMSDEAVSVSQINFPAVSLCTSLIPSYIRPGSRRTDFYRFERHKMKKYYYNDIEFFEEIKEEASFENLTYTNISNYGRSIWHKLLLDYEKILDRVEKGLLKLDKMGIKLLQRLQVVDIIGNRGVFDKFNYSVPNNNFLDVLNEFVKEFDQELYIANFQWINQKDSYVSELITPLGLCLTFNMPYNDDLLHWNDTSDDFSYEFFYITFEGVPVPDMPKVLPRKIATSREGLIIDETSTLKYDPRFTFMQNREYSVLINDPFELPTKKSRVLKIQCKVDDPNILINAQINTIHESIRELKVSERNCYLNNEKMLKFFKEYTKNNCESECLSEFMLNRCGCVEFFMIRKKSTRICSANEKSCYESAHSDFERRKNSCACLQPCTYVQYNYELRYHEMIRANPHRSQARAIVKFKRDFFNKFIRKKQFDTLDFLSFVGGILGLFAGFSVLSFIEIIYWFTVRFCIGSTKRNKLDVYQTKEAFRQNSRRMQFFRSFLKESSIHGFKYLLKFTKAESFLWMIFITISLTFCFDLISNTNEKVPNSRVIAYDDDYRFDENITFPAITIVPPFLVDIDNDITGKQIVIAAFMDNVEIPADPEKEKLFLRNLMKYFFCTNTFDLYSFNLNLSFISQLHEALKELSMVDWFREQFSTFDRKFLPEFAEIRTTRGMGFTFNLIDADKMFDFEHTSQNFNYYRNITTRSEDVQKIPSSVEYPFKFSRQNRPIFSLKLNKFISYDRECLLTSILIHPNDQLPTFYPRSEFIGFQYGMTLNMIVTPEIIRTDDNLKLISPNIRECYFDGEKMLKYFKKYSQKNCEIECMMNYTIKACGCVDTEQPYSKSYNLCVHDEKQSLSYCPDKTQRDLYTSENFSIETNCSCLPMCNSVSYNILYTAEFETNGTEAVINVKMDMSDIILFRRYQQFAVSDVISYVGGLLGLFAGISMLSIVEFFYFFTMRLVVDLKRGMRKVHGWV